MIEAAPKPGEEMIMRIRTYIGIAVLLIVCIIAAGLIYVMSIDVDQYRGFIAEKASAATGRKLTLEGPIKLALGLSPGVVLNGVQLANADWGSRPEMVKLKKLEVQIRLLPLIFGDIQVKRLVLIEPDIWLERDAKGRANWELAPSKPGEAKEETSASGAPVIPVIADLRLHDAKLAFRDGKSGQAYTISLKSAEASAEGFDSPLRFDFQGSWNDLAFSGKGQVGSLAGLTDSSTPYPLDVAANFGGLDLKAKGTVTDPVNLKKIALHVAAEATSLKGLQPIAGDEVAGMGPLSFSSDVSGNLAKIQVKSLKFTAGQSDIQGSAEARLQGAKPSFSAEMTSNRLALKDMLPPPAPGSAPEKSAPPKGAAKDKVFPQTPLPLDALKGIDADFRFTGKEVEANGMTLRDLKVHLAIRNGELSIKPLEGQVGGGALKGEVALNARPSTPTLSIRLNLSKFDLGQILKDAEIKDVYDGKGDLAVNLSGQGKSVAALMGSLTGESKVVMGKGRLKSEALDIAVGGFGKVLGTLTSGAQKYSTVNCAVNKFVFKQGLATSQVMLIDTEYSTVVGEGKINLGQETLNMLVTPKAKSATLNVALPVKVGGTLASPSFRPDELALAKKVGGIAALFVFPPAALVGFGDLGSDEGEECLKIAQGKAPTPKAEKPSTTEKIMKGVEGGAKGVGEKLKGLFGR